MVVTAVRPLNEHSGFKAEMRSVWLASHEEFAQQLPQGRHVITEKELATASPSNSRNW